MHSVALPNGPGARQRLPIRVAVTRLSLALLVVFSTACKDTSGPSANLEVTPGEVELVVGGTRQFTASGAPGALTWSTGDPDVAAVVAATGFVTAIGRGTTQITATSGTATASAQITVLAPASLDLSIPALDFERVVATTAEMQNGDPPPPQTVTVTNGGDVPLTNLAVGTIEWGAGQPTGWLTVTPSGTTAPVTLTFNVQQAALTWGTFTAVVPILASGVANSPQYVAVTFRVLRPPTIAVNPASIDVSGIPGVSINQTVQVSNAGDLPLTGLTRSVFYGARGSGWLQATLTATTAPATLNLTANTTGLDTGTYTATVRVASTLANVTPRDIPVTLVVTTGPTIQLSTNAVTLSTVYSGSPSPANVTITNTGGGTLSGLSLGTITYGGGQTGGWLMPTLSGPSAPATITINAASSQLASGSYTATLPVVSGSAANSPVNLTVNLTVGPTPVIARSPASVQFSRWGGAPRPGPQVVQITNTQNGPLTGLSTSVSYTGGATGWLVRSLNTTTAPAQLTLQPVITNLAAGVHTATVTISSSMTGVASTTVAITYTVQTFTVNVYPNFNTLLTGNFVGQRRCTDCHFSGGQTPNFSGTAAQVNTLLQANYITAGNATGSTIVCKPFGTSCTHGGGKFTQPSTFSNALIGWINAGAPFQ